MVTVGFKGAGTVSAGLNQLKIGYQYGLLWACWWAWCVETTDFL